MSRIKSKNSKLETEVFSYLKNKGLRFRRHSRGIVGRPDIAISSKKKAVFIDSDFWHGWQYPRWKHKLPNTFWRKKLETNRQRDRIVNSRLKKAGYSVFRVWSHQLKSNQGHEFLEKIYDFLAN